MFLAILGNARRRLGAQVGVQVWAAIWVGPSPASAPQKPKVSASAMHAQQMCVRVKDWHTAMHAESLVTHALPPFFCLITVAAAYA